MKHLRKANINTQVHYIPITHHPYYKKLGFKSKLNETENYYKKALSIPIFYDLKNKEQKHIVQSLKKIIK